MSAYWTLKEEFPDGSPLEVTEFQQEAVEAWERANQSGFVVLPCGAGKTLVAIMIALKAGRRVLFLTPGCVTHQFERDLKTFTTVEHEYIHAMNGKSKHGKNNYEHNTLQEYLIATHQMFTGTKPRAEEGMERMRYVHNEPWDLVVWDEGQHSEAPTYKKFLKTFLERGIKILALTATKYHDDENAFTYIGPTIYEVGLKQLESQGSIAKLHVTQVNIPVDNFTKKAIATSVRTKAGINGQHIACTTPSHLDAIRKILYLHRNNIDKHKSRVLVYASFKVTAELYYEELRKTPGQHWGLYTSADYNDKNISSEHLQMVDDFRNGKYTGLVATQIANEGLDVVHPHFDVIINACGNSSKVSIMQRIGRVQRTKRVFQLDDESDEAFLARKLRQQKKAYVYELNPSGVHIYSRYSQKRMNTVREQGFQVQEIDMTELVSRARALKDVTKVKLEERIRLAVQHKTALDEAYSSLVHKREVASSKLARDDTESDAFKKVEKMTVMITKRKLQIKTLEDEHTALKDQLKYQDKWIETKYTNEYDRKDLLVRVCIGTNKRQHAQAARKAITEKIVLPGRRARAIAKKKLRRDDSGHLSILAKRKKKMIAKDIKEAVVKARTATKELAEATVTDSHFVREICYELKVPQDIIAKYKIKQCVAYQPGEELLHVSVSAVPPTASASTNTGKRKMSEEI